MSSNPPSLLHEPFVSFGLKSTPTSPPIPLPTSTLQPWEKRLLDSGGGWVADAGRGGAGLELCASLTDGHCSRRVTVSLAADPRLSSLCDRPHLPVRAFCLLCLASSQHRCCLTRSVGGRIANGRNSAAASQPRLGLLPGGRNDRGLSE